MRLSRLSIRLFRNISFIEFKPHQVLNFIFGDNAQGKTSLLESIYFLSALKTFRAGKTADLVQRGAPGFQIEATLLKKAGALPLDLKIRCEGGTSKKLFVGEKPAQKSKFISELKTVVFSPESLAAIKYGPELRRDLVDQAVFQISAQAASSQSEFNRALRQRNACLRQLKSGLINPQQGHDLLESIQPGFLNAAAEVTLYRLEFIDAIFESMEHALSEILGTKTRLRIVESSNDREWTERGFQSVLDRLSKELADPSKAAAEQVLGATLTGPHRHDLSFLFNGNDSRIFCSQGQQRALILAFKIAEIVYHRRVFDSFPLLLLDDVLSEFDEGKRRFLVDFLLSNEAQTFLTTTDQAQILKGCSVFQIEGGSLKQLESDQ